MEHLREEFDLTDTATTNLDIEVEGSARFLHSYVVPEHFFERDIIEIPSVHERLYELEEPTVELSAARNRPGLDESKTLERFAPHVVVLAVLLERICDVAAARHGPQAQIDPIQEPLVGKFGEQRHQLAPKLQKQQMRRLVFFVVRLAHEDQVDVGAIVQLSPAELAHAGYRKPARQPLDPGCLGDDSGRTPQRPLRNEVREI